MKTLTLPFLPELNADDPAGVIDTLERRGHRAAIDETPWHDQFPYVPLTTVTAAHDGKRIYLDFFVRCNYLRAETYKPQGDVYKDSCVEAFLQPREDGEYFNLEFNCIGTKHAARRMGRPNPTPLSLDELDRIITYPSCGTRPFCEIQGLFTWNLLVVIPLDLLGLAYDHKPLVIKGNFYKCAGATSAPHFLAWNPVTAPKPDFHRPECFGTIILE